MTENLFVGIDLGGTKILASPLVLGKEFKILGKAKNPTRIEGGISVIVDDIVKTVIQSLNRAQLNLKSIRSVGIGIPGAVDVNNGRVIMASNLGWENVKIKNLLEKKLKVSVFVDNDVNLGVLGEQQYGAARGAMDVAGIFWGTGIGGGIVLHGKIHHGHSFTAGEIGHLVMVKNGPLCNCGNRGCLESIAGKWAITRDWKNHQNKFDEKPAEDIKSDATILKSKMIRQAYNDGDAFMIEALQNSCSYIGMSLSAIVNLLNPQIIVLGGGMIESMGDELLPEIRESMEKHLFPHTTVKLKIAKLGDFAVLTGAAVFARQMIT